MNSDSHIQASSDNSPKSKKFEAIDLLCESRFPIYKVQSKQTNNFYALKFFPYEDKKISPFYLNESRFFRLSHKNIIKYYVREDHDITQIESKEVEFSYLMMELAPYGDFTGLLMENKFPSDEKLVRTYFRQLVEGVEYLHSNGTYHLDLKLDNLLLGADFQLKIADFDSSYKSGDAMIMAEGTKNYRAPELKGQCLLDPAAADVYSMGIILFLLLMRCFPYTETLTETNADFLWKYLLDDYEKFWSLHDNDGVTSSFKRLFRSMTMAKPSERATIREIKYSAWYNGPVYSKFELYNIMSQVVNGKKKTL